MNNFTKTTGAGTLFCPSPCFAGGGRVDTALIYPSVLLMDDLGIFYE